MFKGLLLSERGIVEAPSVSFLLFFSVLALFFSTVIYVNYINPPKTADDLFLLNSSTIRIPVAQCEIRGIIRENQPVSLTVANEKGRAVETVPDARVFSVTDNAVEVLVRRAEGTKIPPLSVNRLHVVLEPKS
jgi:hypothetical protein